MSMRKGTPITFNGVEYPSISAVATKLGITPAKLYSLKKDDNSWDDVIKKAVENNQHPQRSKNDYDLSVNGKTYVSISDFCLDYGLKYTRVVYHLHRGKTLEEILNLCKQLPIQARTSEISHKAIPCTYEGIKYPSISVAAEALGIPAHQIYIKKNLLGVSADEALRRAVEETYLDKDVDDLKRPITVAGVRYPSKGAACKAYGMSYITVQSRVSRNKISFEEALLRGKKARGNIIADYSKWKDLSLVPFDNDEEKPKNLIGIINILEANAYHPTVYQDIEKSIAAIKVSEALHPLDTLKSIYILMSTEQCEFPFSIEFIIPHLVNLAPLDDKDELELYRLLNELNQIFLGAKIFVLDGNLAISMSHIASKSSFSTRAFLAGFHHFIGTSAPMYDAVKGFEIPQSTPPERAN